MTHHTPHRPPPQGHSQCQGQGLLCHNTVSQALSRHTAGSPTRSCRCVEGSRKSWTSWLPWLLCGVKKHSKLTCGDGIFILTTPNFWYHIDKYRVILVNVPNFIGPILDDRLNENSWKPLSVSVCVSADNFSKSIFFMGPMEGDCWLLI